VAKGLDNLDRIGMQHIIRTVVRRIEIDDTSRSSSGSHHQMVHRDQDHQSKQLILGNIVQALVERTFAWLSRFRRLARDFERYARTVAAFIHLAMIRIMLERLVASSSS
jgi:transposase